MVAPLVVDQVLAGHFKTAGGGRLLLNEEQNAMVRDLATSPDGVQVVNAKAGSGKTSVLRAARETWESAGYRVVGVALAARAAQELHLTAGITSETTAKLLRDLAQPSSYGMAKGTVLVVDEAGMVGTRQLASLLHHAQLAGAKVVAVGDVQQLPEIEAGGLFRSLAQRLGAVELRTNQRQREPWEREALDFLRSGDAIAAIARYAQHDRVVVRSRAGRLRRRMVDDWWAAMHRPGERPPIMIAQRHSDVAELNSAARELLAEQGRIGGNPIRIARREFAVGDRIITLRNARRLGVLNGTFATVIGVDHDRRALLVRTDEGREVVLPRWYSDRCGPLDRRRVDHAYATTCHKAQGMTTDRAFVLATDDIYKEWGYVAMSRGRLENRLYLAVGDRLAEELDTPPERNRDGMLDLTAALEQSNGKYLALDQLVGDPEGAGDPARFPSNSGSDSQLTLPRGPHPQSLTAAEHEDLASLQAFHRACSIDLLHAREQVAAGHLGWHQRRVLSKAIIDGERTLADLELRITKQKAPPTTTVGDRLETSPAATPRMVHRELTRYLIAELGGWPQTEAAQAVWRIAARQIDAYRISAGVSDPANALGSPPDDPAQRSRHDNLATLIQEAGKVIDALDRPALPDPTDGVTLSDP
jgi:hypothetical protein